ncbi:hypothetical protein JL721_818 [Aureococcus anophagefferens]|nr:hypothetical protein JL721_818 [Aureococcus anophagefferens]
MQLRGVLACLALACADAGPFGRKKNAKVEVAASGALAAGADGLLAALDAELAATEALIAASQRKVELLGALRRAAAAGAALPAAGGDACASLAAASASRRARGAARRAAPPGAPGVARPPPGRRRRRAAAAAAAERLRRQRRRRRLRRERLGHGQGQRRGRRGPSVPVFNYVNLLLLAYDNGTIAFHDAAGEVVAAVDTGHAGGVAAVAFDGAEEPVLATAGAGGEVQFYNLTLWQGDAVVAGGGAARGPDEDDGGAPPPPPPRPAGPALRSSSGLGLVVRPEATVAPAYAPVEQPDGSYETELARVAHLQLFTWRGSGKFVAAADDLGSVRIYARNGTKQGEVAVVATDAPITALKRSGSAFAVADGAVVRFVSSSRWRLSPAVCRGPPATVSDVAFDALNPGVLHVAYETGELLAFNTRARQGDGGAPACRLTTKLPSFPHVAPPKLATTKGFLRLANESDAAPPHTFAASFVAGMSMQEILFAYDDGAGQGAGGVRVLESLLRYDPPDRDISWMRMPILFVGLIVVFGFQILRKNGGGRGGGAFGKLGGGRGGISDVDMDAINQMAERMGRNGEGGDMAAAMAGLGGMGGGGMGGGTGGGGFRGGAAGGRVGPMGGGGRRGRY